MIYFVILIMTILGAVAGYFLKKASDGSGILYLIRNKYFYFGALIYLLAAIMNIIALTILPYSVVLPLTAVTYIWTLLIAHFYLEEIISLKKIIGVGLIIIGAICVTL